MTDYIIVGAGISGLVVGQILKSLGKSFIGLEQKSKFGGRSETGHHRVLSGRSVDYLKRWAPIDWVRVDEAPMERKKGEWVSPEILDQDAERFYLSTSFFQPRLPFSRITRDLSSNLIEDFQFKKTIERIDTKNRLIQCQDGSEYAFHSVIWCAPLSLLQKTLSNESLTLLKPLKKGLPNKSGLNIDFTLSTRLFPFQNSVVFPFRFKDSKLRAIGNHEIGGESDGKTPEVHLHWIIFLEEMLSEDREEIAKVVRTFKRELQKEFTQFQNTVLHEKITFLPTLSGDVPLPIKSLELANGIYYVGPQARLLGEASEDAELINIDRAVVNCRAFEHSIQTQA